jgi:hypothetical protein
MGKHAPEPMIPAWPALLTTELACAYSQLSDHSFRWLAHQHGLKPVECAGLAVTRWRRTDLDRLIDSLPAKGDQMRPGEAESGAGATQPSLSTDPAADALARAARRASRARGG